VRCRTAVCACDHRTHRPHTGCYQRVTTGRTVLLPGCDQRVSALDNPARHFWRNGTPEGRGRQTRTLEGWERSDSADSPHARSCSVPGWQLLPCSCGKATAHTSYPLDVSGGERGATAVSREGSPDSEGRANLPCPTRRRRERRHNPSSPGVSAPAPTAAARSACVTGMLSIVQVSAHGLFPLASAGGECSQRSVSLFYGCQKCPGCLGATSPRGLDFSGLTASSKCGPGNRARTRANAGGSCRGHGLRWGGGVPRRTRRGPILVRASIRTPAHGIWSTRTARSRDLLESAVRCHLREPLHPAETGSTRLMPLYPLADEMGMST
jgi:hypothetical protein